MKRIAIVVATLATLAGSTAHAQTTKNQAMGAGAQAAKSCDYSAFAWGIGLGALVVLGVVVGVTVGAAVGDPSTSH